MVVCRMSICRENAIFFTLVDADPSMFVFMTLFVCIYVDLRLIFIIYYLIYLNEMK